MKITIIVFAIFLCPFSSAEDNSYGVENNFCEFVKCPVGTICDHGVCVPFDLPNCPPQVCSLACEFGFKQDENGCPICSCLELFFNFESVAQRNRCNFRVCPRGQECDRLTGRCFRRCPKMMCALYCPNGFKIRNGCQVCACERMPF